MAIVTLANQKGGPGKTTLATNLAILAHLNGKRTVIIDADPQGSALDWHAARIEACPIRVIGYPLPKVHVEAESMRPDYDLIFIDTPARSTDIARSAILAADMVLIPVQPSPYDVWSSRDTTALLAEASVFKAGQKSAFVINRRIANTAIGNDVRTALAQFDQPTFAAQITQRVLFAESAASGMAVVELAPDSLAAREIAGVLAELEGYV